MFQRLALLKLDPAHATAEVRAAIRDRLVVAVRRGGFDAQVGLPADEASEKSWDVSLAVSFRTRQQLESFDSTGFLRTESGVAEAAIAVIKGWGFEVRTGL